MIVNKHLQKSSNGVGLGAQHCRKCPSNIWIETFSGVIVEDEEADPLILDLPFTLALPIYFGSFPHCLRTSIIVLMIGQCISSNGGVVAAEELAPFLDVKTTEDMKLGKEPEIALYADYNFNSPTPTLFPGEACVPWCHYFIFVSWKLIIPHGSFNHFGCFALLQESERWSGNQDLKIEGRAHPIMLLPSTESIHVSRA
uniref:Uncharacterized protein n=1 Tax=Populus trichocarpa TaxID=3694 RepID=U5GFV5_POPTR